MILTATKLAEAYCQGSSIPMVWQYDILDRFSISGLTMKDGRFIIPPAKYIPPAKQCIPSPRTNVDPFAWFQPDHSVKLEDIHHQVRHPFTPDFGAHSTGVNFVFLDITVGQTYKTQHKVKVKSEIASGQTLKNRKYRFLEIIGFLKIIGKHKKKLGKKGW